MPERGFGSDFVPFPVSFGDNPDDKIPADREKPGNFSYF